MWGGGGGGLKPPQPLRGSCRIQLLYSFMKYDYEKLISPSFREFYKLSIDIQVCGDDN